MIANWKQDARGLKCVIYYLISTRTRPEVLVGEVELFDAKGAKRGCQYEADKISMKQRKHIPELIIVINDGVNLLTARHFCR